MRDNLRWDYFDSFFYMYDAAHWNEIICAKRICMEYTAYRKLNFYSWLNLNAAYLLETFRGFIAIFCYANNDFKLLIVCLATIKYTYLLANDLGIIWFYCSNEANRLGVHFAMIIDVVGPNDNICFTISFTYYRFNSRVASHLVSHCSLFLFLLPFHLRLLPLALPQPPPFISPTRLRLPPPPLLRYVS